MDATVIDGLTRSIRGRVVTPADDDFDDVRQTFNATVDRRPPVIVQAEDTDDVVTAVRAAAAAGLPIAVRGGGHSVAGHAMAEDAIIIDLRRMRGVAVDPVARRARVQGGALWEDVDRATIPARPRHDRGHVLGHRRRRAHALRRARVADGDGRAHLRQPDARDGRDRGRRGRRGRAGGDPELLWALRGGGGNFGVVTEFEFQLHPIGAVAGGSLHRPPRRCRRRSRGPGRVRAADARRDRDVRRRTVDGGPRRPSARMRPVRFDHVVCSLVFQGTPDEAEAAFAPLAAQPHWSGEHRGPRPTRRSRATACCRSACATTGRAISCAMSTGRRPRPSPTPCGPAPAVPVVRAARGDQRPARVEPEGGAAFGQREARWNAARSRSGRTRPTTTPRSRGRGGRGRPIAPSSYSGAGYANYASADETAERVRAAFGEERFARLQAVKRRYDPDNMFRFNLNVPPGPPAS